MKENTKTTIFAISYGIADAFYEGNDVSQRMGRILKVSLEILERSEPRFDRMREELESVYNEMSRTHNRMYQDLGGELGSGKFFAVDIEDLTDKTEINFKKLLDGINPDAFMQLQITISRLRELVGIVADGTPFKTPQLGFIERFEWAHWLAFMSVYESNHRDKVLKILSKYDPKAS